MLRVPIEVSARHVHLTEAHIQKLFGHPLTVLKPISQKGQFAAIETVRLEGKRQKARGKRRGVPSGRFLENVRIVGPARKESQVELSISDCRLLGLKNVPFKISGSLKETPGMILTGPKGNVVLRQGVMVALRHIHCPSAIAKKLGLKDGGRVSVKMSGERGVVFENVMVRVRKDFVWRMHVDTDEANAAGIVHGGKGIVIIRKV